MNDAFVMGAWGKASNATGKVRMLADGNGEFTKALGLDLDASGFGMGQRSQRYAMIVKDGTVGGAGGARAGPQRCPVPSPCSASSRRPTRDTSRVGTGREGEAFAVRATGVPRPAKPARQARYARRVDVSTARLARTS